MRLTVALGIALLAVALVAAAAASTAGLRVIGSGRSAGDYAVTSASGSKNPARALYLRGYGHGLSGYAVVACSRGFSIGSKSTTFGSMVSGRLYRLKQPFAGDCDVTASLSGSGSIRLQILG